MLEHENGEARGGELEHFVEREVDDGGAIACTVYYVRSSVQDDERHGSIYRVGKDRDLGFDTERRSGMFGDAELQAEELGRKEKWGHQFLSERSEEGGGRDSRERKRLDDRSWSSSRHEQS